MSAPHAGRRERPFHGIDRVVMQLVEFVARATPVADIRLVPGLPVPFLHLRPGHISPRNARSTDKQVPPTWRNPSADRPIQCRFRHTWLWVSICVDKARAFLRIPGHEADLRVGMQAALEIGVEDAVDDRPVVNGVALGVLAIGTGRAPLQSGGSIAAREQVMRAEIDGPRPKLAQFAEEFLPSFM